MTSSTTSVVSLELRESRFQRFFVGVLVISFLHQRMNQHHISGHPLNRHDQQVSQGFRSWIAFFDVFQISNEILPLLQSQQLQNCFSVAQNENAVALEFGQELEEKRAQELPLTPTLYTFLFKDIQKLSRNLKHFFDVDENRSIQFLFLVFFNESESNMLETGKINRNHSFNIFQISSKERKKKKKNLFSDS